MAVPRALPVFTPEEYLSLERFSNIRHEYLDGVVYPVASQTPTHSGICFNLAGVIGSQIIDSACRGFSPNMKVRAGEKGLYAYPDLAVVCGEPVFHDDQRDALVNPTVVFEVLSPSTEAYDRGEKFLRYSTGIETWRDYVLVSQDRPRVEHFTRKPDGTWSRSEVGGMSGILSLPSIDCEIPLADVYSRIAFPEKLPSQSQPN